MLWKLSHRTDINLAGQRHESRPQETTSQRLRQPDRRRHPGSHDPRRPSGHLSSRVLDRAVVPLAVFVLGAGFGYGALQLRLAPPCSRARRAAVPRR
jgi:hypothetical protein